MKLRNTHQTQLVLAAAQTLGHATNAQLLTYVQQEMPQLSATTVHRITNRLIQAGLLRHGPEIHGSRIIDANISSHDHFYCQNCGGLKDIAINDISRRSLQQQIGTNIMQSQLLISGDCMSC